MITTWIRIYKYILKTRFVFDVVWHKIVFYDNTNSKNDFI